MRNSKEIKQALAILAKQADRISLVQADVLRDRRSEVWVFEHYVRDMPKQEQDETVYCAARDAAQYLSGKIELEDLIPGVTLDKLSVTDTDCDLDDPDKIVVSKRTLFNLLKRVNHLEKALGIRKVSMKINRKSINGEVADDLISQIDACKYVGCGKTTIKRWADKGIITGYKKGTRVYFSKRELDRSKVVREHRMMKPED